jgi:hypothetical protein
MIDNIPAGYSEWFRKNDTIVRSGYFDEGGGGMDHLL